MLSYTGANHPAMWIQTELDEKQRINSPRTGLVATLLVPSSNRLLFTAQKVAYRPASASPGSSLGRQNLRSHPRPTKLESES